MIRPVEKKPADQLLLVITSTYLPFPHLGLGDDEPIELCLLNDDFGNRCTEDGFFIICNSDPDNPDEQIYRAGTLAYITHHEAIKSAIIYKVIFLTRVLINEVSKIDTETCKYLSATWEVAQDKEISPDDWSSPAFQKHLHFFSIFYAETFLNITDILDAKIKNAKKEKNEKTVRGLKTIISECMLLLKMLASPERKVFGGILDRIAYIIFSSSFFIVKDDDLEEDLLKKCHELYFELDVGNRFTMLQMLLLMLLPRVREFLVEKEDVLVKKKENPYIAKYNEIKGRLSEEVKDAIKYEISRMNKNSEPTHMVREHLELLLNVPWGIYTNDEENFSEIQRKLDESHFGLDKIKERILEYIAILQQNPNTRAPILCFVGPPGVGKTSLGQAIANALGRKFTRLSLGGMTDETEIKGHRGTYINAKPGRIIESLKRVGSANPVFMLDELDKITKHWKGDPSATLLEALDPEQNKAFLDTYLDVPFDLSQILFITTANMVDTIHPALLDRLEIIEIPSYTPQEKFQIAKIHLISRRKKENGFPQEINGSLVDIVFPDTILMKIIYGYTQEAGVRGLERVLDKPYRRLAKELRLIPEAHKESITINDDNIHHWCGNSEVMRDTIPEVLPAGVVPVLAVTDTGGFVFMAEVGFKLSASTRKIAITGIRASGESKESVNKIDESFRAAFDALTDVGGILEKRLEEHEKNGALFIGGSITGSSFPKDGPSAGISLYLALYGILTNQSIKPNIETKLLAATGAITRKLEVVEAVGGVRNKLIRAEREGIKRVIIPYQNKKDLEDVPEEVRSKLEIMPIKYMWEALAIAYPSDIQVKKYIKSKKLNLG